MRIGIICEGPTDYIVIKEFLGASLLQRKIESTFISIQPDPDNTLGDGWTRVFYWLENNPPQNRIQSYFDGGLFGGNLSAKQCDMLIVQIDSDILGEASFEAELQRKGISINVPTAAIDRGQEVGRILECLCCLDELTEVDRGKHVIAPTVEASETWCVAAFERRADDPEELRGQDLRDAFGSVLARSEGRDVTFPYGGSNKTPKRRQSFCEKHATSRFIEGQAAHFLQLVNRVLATQN